jgi:hypothetical protein
MMDDTTLDDTINIYARIQTVTCNRDLTGIAELLNLNLEEKMINHMCVYLICSGYLDGLKLMHERGVPIYKFSCRSATRSKNLECLRYLHENGCQLDEPCVLAAVFNGDMDCLRYLHENGQPLISRALCVKAAEMDKLESLRYLHEHGCPWYEDVCTEAAKNGSVECLKYAIEHGCPWFRTSFTMIHPNCKQYVIENGLG